MPHEKIARLAGDEHLFSMKGNPIDHCFHKNTAGMAHGMEKSEDEVADVLKGRKKGMV